MTRSLSLTILLALTCCLAVGCQTWVNIPAQAGDAASNNPNGKTARKVILLAMQAAIEDGGIDGPVQIMLPQRADNTTYTYVRDNLGIDAVIPNDEEMTAVEGVIFARGVRIRGHRGEVDIVRPAGDGVDQLVSVTLRWQMFSGWGPEGVRVWRGVSIED